ncbi:MAG: hypothetical protein WBC85_06525 [Planktotalea sp.]|uniref:hypothetical protein n=1 Tax=Planktotalea sp. TaxID=2029877 RepID=UPI003C75B030
MTYQSSNAILANQVLAIITPVLQRARSESDLRERLAHLGYGYRETAKGRMLTTVPQGVDVVLIPALNSPA